MRRNKSFNIRRVNNRDFGKAIEIFDVESQKIRDVMSQHCGDEPRVVDIFTGNLVFENEIFPFGENARRVVVKGKIPFEFSHLVKRFGNAQT